MCVQNLAHHSTVCMLFIEKEFIYDVVVREEDIELTENSFHLTVPDDDSIIFKTTERATTASRTVKTLTGSESFTVS